MSLVDIDSWLNEYESCEKLSHAILAKLTERDQTRPNGYSELTRTIHMFLDQFDKELRQLKQKLDTSARSQTITFEETERRQRLVEILQSKFQQSKNKFTASTRSDLIPSSSRSLWQDDDVPIIDTTNDVENLMQTQIQIMEDQNRGLDALANSISRQKELASKLGQEVEEQNDILDTLADSMDRVDTRVSTETSNIGAVNRQDSTWGHWIVILILFVAIVIVSLI